MTGEWIARISGSIAGEPFESTLTIKVVTQ